MSRTVTTYSIKITVTAVSPSSGGIGFSEIQGSLFPPFPRLFPPSRPLPLSQAATTDHPPLLTVFLADAKTFLATSRSSVLAAGAKSRSTRSRHARDFVKGEGAEATGDEDDEEQEDDIAQGAIDAEFDLTADGMFDLDDEEQFE